MVLSASRPLRIGILTPYDLAPQAGGVRQHAFHLKRALERGGDAVFLLGPTSQASQPPFETSPNVFALPGVVTVPVNGTRSSVGMAVSPLALLRLCRALKLDVLHLHEPQVPTMSWGLCWWLRGVAKVATFHAADEGDSIPLLRAVSGSMVYRFIDRGITVSKAAERRTAQTWKRPLAVIPNGVCTDTFFPAHAPAAGRRTNKVKLLFVGALGDERKGARVMLEAFARARQAGFVGELTMVGSRRGFALDAPAAGVRFREGLSDQELADCFRACDALVAPAIGRESFGMILLEAMASRKPVISSDIAGYREVARGEGVLFVPPNDAGALANALERFAGVSPQQREAMGAANLALALPYAWEHVAAAVRQEYVAALAGRVQSRRSRQGAMSAS